MTKTNSEPTQDRTKAYEEMVAAGQDPRIAAEIIDLGFLSFEEWRDHYLHYGDNRSSAYHEQMVRY